MSVTEEYLRQRREREENIRLKLADTANYDPDRAARITKVGHFTGLPESVIDADLDNVEEQLRQRNFDPEIYRKNSPKFATFAAKNPYNLSILKKDQEHMTWLERSSTQIGLAYDASWFQNEAMLIGARRSLGDFRDNDTERLKELQKYQVPHDFGATNPLVKLVVWGAKHIASTQYTMKIAAPYVPAGAAIGAALGAPGGITAGAGAVLGSGVAGIYGLFKGGETLIRGEAYNQYIDMGFSHKDAAFMSHIVGPIGGAAEAFGLGVTVKAIPGAGKLIGAGVIKAVADLVAKPTFIKAFGALAIRYGETYGSEIFTELIQESAQIAGGEVLKSRTGIGTPMTFDEYMDQLGNITIETMKGAALLTSVGPIMNFSGDSYRAYKAHGAERIYKDAGEAVKGSTTRTESPATYNEFVDDLAKDKKILIDIDVFREYFQEVGQDPDKVASDLGINLSEAEVAGVEIEISWAEWLKQIGPTEHYDALSADVKPSFDDMSTNESVVFEKDNAEILKAFADQEAPKGHKPVPEIYEDQYGQLMAIPGMTASTAEKYAKFNEYLYSTLAVRNQKDPLELYNQYFGGVKQAVPEIFQKRDIDIHVDPLLDAIRAKDFPLQREIYGDSLTDFLTAKGGLSEDSELTARDVAKEFKKLMKDGKLSLDAAAELAFEAGFIAEHDEAQLLEALDTELGGRPVFGRGGGDPQLADRARAIDQLMEFLESEGIDIDAMSNAEIRRQLEGGRTFEQSDLEKLTETAILMAEKDPKLLGKALLTLPKIPADQDFGDLQFTDTVAVEGSGQAFEVSQPAQKTFDRAVKRRGVIEKLLECVSG